MSEITLEVLLARAQTGDRGAFGQLVERFQSTVYAVALSRLRDAHEAVELVQDVFLHVQSRLGQLRDPACFPGWLRQITVRMAINRQVRSRRFASAEPEAIAQTPDRTDGPLDRLLSQEAKSELLVGLERLKPLDRDTLVAFYFGGQSLEQMSQATSTPVGTIKRRLHVARNRLRDVLEGASAVCNDTPATVGA